MNVRRLTVWLAAIAFTTARAEKPSEPLARTTSVTGQFVAYAGNPALPPVVCVFAERVKSAWRDRLEITNQWRDPIVIVIRPRDATATNALAVRTDIFQTEFHLKYQITCLVPPPIQEPELVAAVIDALCAETANRNEPTLRGKSYIAPPIPVWLSQGLAQSIDGRPDFLLETARRSVDAGRPQNAVDLLNVAVAPGEPAERELFKANAWLFTEALLAQPGGPRKLQRFLTELGATKSTSNAFWSAYAGDFPRPAALEKWWSVERMRRVTAVVAENLSLDETSARLARILVATLARPASKRGADVRSEVSLAHLWRYYEQPWLKPLLVDRLNQLRTLRSQAHPYYHMVIDQYCDAIMQLINQELNRFRRSVAKADRSRVAADRTRQQITRYLGGAEHVHAPDEWEGTFRSYFHTLDQVEALERKRSSPISDYLDKFDH